MKDKDQFVAIAIDDEPLALEVVKAHAAHVPFLTLERVFTDAAQAAAYLQKAPMDLIFLDIRMPDVSGMDFLAQLSQRPMVIFTTAYSEHAVAGFELDAVDYLLKPFSLQRFVKACEKARQWHQLHTGEQNAFVLLKSGYETIKLSLSEILYVESAGNYMAFITATSRILCRMSVEEVLALLPEKKFLRIHRSFVVAVDKMEKVGRQRVTIQGVAIPVGSHYRQNLARLEGRS